MASSYLQRWRDEGPRAELVLSRFARSFGSRARSGRGRAGVGAGAVRCGSVEAAQVAAQPLHRRTDAWRPRDIAHLAEARAARRRCMRRSPLAVDPSLVHEVYMFVCSMLPSQYGDACACVHTLVSSRLLATSRRISWHLARAWRASFGFATRARSRRLSTCFARKQSAGASIGRCARSVRAASGQMRYDDVW